MVQSISPCLPLPRESPYNFLVCMALTPCLRALPCAYVPYPVRALRASLLTPKGVSTSKKVSARLGVRQRALLTFLSRARTCTGQEGGSAPKVRSARTGLVLLCFIEARRSTSHLLGPSTSCLYKSSICKEARRCCLWHARAPREEHSLHRR